MLQGHACEALQLDGEEPELVQRMVFEGIGSHLRLAQIGFLKAVGIDDEDAVGFQVGYIDLQRRGIHGNQDIHSVPRRVHVIGGKMKLIAAYARQRSGRSANLRGEVRKCSDIIAIQRHRIGELAAGDLHAVAGVSGEADDGLIDLLAPVFGQRRFNESGHKQPDPVWRAPLRFSPQGARLS